jgi:hypothetical protein
MLIISSDHGRIGELWWINADTSVRTTQGDPLGLGIQREFHAIRWGTFGFGREIRIHLQDIDA